MTTFISPVAPPPLTPGGRTAVRIALIIAASVLVLGSVTGLAVTAWSLSAVRVTNDTEPLPTGMRSLTVDAAGSPALIRIVADRNAAEPRVDLRLVNTRQSAAAAVTVTNDAAGTRVSFASPSGSFMDWHRGADLTVTLPPEMARQLSVTVEQDDGALMAEADLDQLVARTTDGAVLLSGSARRIDVDSQDGSVRTRDPISVSESFRVTATDGNIAVDFKDAAPRTVEVTAENGDVAIALPPRGPYLVDANTNDETETAAMIRVPRTSDRGSAASVVTVRANDGDVAITTLRR